MAYEFANKGYFKNFGAMWDAYYPEYAGMMSDKSDDPYLTTTTGIRQIMYGPGLMAQFVVDANAFGMLPTKSWGDGGSGRRLITAPYFGSSPDGSAIEGGTTPDSARDTVDPIAYTPKQLAPKAVEMSLVELSVENIDNNAKWSELVDARREIILNEQDQVILSYAGAGLAGTKLETLDRIVGSYDQITNGGESMAAGRLDYEGKDRDAAATVYDGQIVHNSGTLSRLTLNMIDAMTFRCKPFWKGQSIRNKVYLTGPGSEGRITQLMKTIVRGEIPTAPVSFGVNGVQTVEGAPGSTIFNKYNGMVIVSDKFVDAHYTASLTGLEKVYALDLDHLAMWWSMPWQYQESQEVLATGKLGRKGIFLAVGNVTADKFGCHGKVQCIN